MSPPGGGSGGPGTAAAAAAPAAEGPAAAPGGGRRPAGVAAAGPPPSAGWSQSPGADPTTADRDQQFSGEVIRQGLIVIFQWGGHPSRSYCYISVGRSSVKVLLLYFSGEVIRQGLIVIFQ